MISKEIKDKTGDTVFVTATDGNHGRGVAWTANQLNQKSVVYMQKGSAIERLNNILAEGAEASIMDMNYDEAVRLADKQAQEKGWIVVQDTAWEGYEDIPTWIMQGYMTLGYEIVKQLEESKADCIYRTAEANDGKLHFVTDDLDTIMAGLACGEPNSIGWNVLRDYADAFISCPDYVAVDGMRVMASPLDDDNKVVSGESGAAPLGCIYNVLTDDSLVDLKGKLGLDENSRLLFISTEGDTDKELIELTQKMIQAKSYSGEEKQAAEIIGEFCKANGFDDVTYDKYGNVIGIIKGKHPGPKVLFDGHIDTVPVSDPTKWTQDPFKGDIVDGKLYGRGISDMKGAVSAFTAAAKYFAEDTNRDFAGEILIGWCCSRRMLRRCCSS